jgi:hypothetical protein
MGKHENGTAGSPLIPPASETRLRLTEAGFPFSGQFSRLGSCAWRLAP